jgi:OmpA-OmpF porin, OOP family
MSRTKTACAIAAALTVALVACGGANSAGSAGGAGGLPGSTCVMPAGPLVVAMSRRANSPGDLPDPVKRIVQRFIISIPAGVTGPKLSLINVDGRPYVARSGQFYSDAGNTQAHQDDQQNFLVGFLNEAAAMRAREPEVDILAALDKAGIPAGRPAAGTVVLADSGLSTTGVLDFSQQGVLDASADELVSFLRTTNALPDLHGLTVMLVGIGEVARPQQELGPRKKHLVELWTKIAEASGAACVASIEVTRSDDPLTGDVKPVKLVPIPPPAVYEPHKPFVLPDAGEVGFQEGKAEFRDIEAARRVLQPIAAQLKVEPTYHLQLTGTTARWGPRDDQLRLAKERAETVKRELVELGAAPSQIETRGVGSYFPQYVPDIGPSGVQLPGPAQQNRTVRIAPCAPTCSSDT